MSEPGDVVEISDEEDDDADVTLGVMARGAEAVHDAAHGDWRWSSGSTQECAWCGTWVCGRAECWTGSGTWA